MVDDQDRSVSARVDPEGHYVVTGVKTGTLRFAVVSPNPAGVTPTTKKPGSKSDPEAKPDARATPGAAAPKSDLKWRPLPKQYEDPGRSGITTVVTRGDNVFDIDLK
ncbi:hypothetical protein [Frigoriglobus tundricola]|uniref:hypothetical protein n=1 Tax=Frigoriglobus tundricola TaxID=2774151 RepID=UPI00148EE754|nr:hypothetical protein [Frigoriglobus tundricola]